jgi:hypothetical protein
VPGPYNRPVGREAADPQLTPELRKTVLAVTDWLGLLDKAMKSFRMYAPGHPTVTQLLARLTERTRGLLEEAGEITLAVKPHEFVLAGQAVLRNDEKQDNYCFKLHQDGIRQLTFRKGFDDAELPAFLEILRTDFESYEHCDEDVVTLLWKRGFNHLSYVVVEALIESGGGASLEQAVLSAVAQLTKGELPPSIREDLQASTGRPRKLKPSDIREISGLPELTARDESPLTEELLSNVKSQIDSDEETLIQKTLVILFRALADFDAIAAILRKLIASLVRLGRFALASKILLKLRSLLEGPVPSSGGGRFLAGFYESFGAPEIGGEIKTVTLKKGFKSFSELKDLAGALPSGAFPTLFDLFRITPLNGVREALTAPLSRSASDHMELIAGVFRGAGKELALSLVELFADAGSEAAGPVLRRALHHEEAVVRGRALELLDGAHLDWARPLLQGALKDVDPVIRVKALHHLVRAKDLKSARAVLDVVRDKDFDDRNLEEKRGFFMALAVLGGTALQEFFRQELDRGMLSRSDADNERRIAAAHALAHLGNADARRSLQEVRDQKTIPTRVKKACDEILASWPMVGRTE